MNFKLKDYLLLLILVGFNCQICMAQWQNYTMPTLRGTHVTVDGIVYVLGQNTATVVHPRSHTTSMDKGGYTGNVNVGKYKEIDDKSQRKELTWIPPSTTIVIRSEIEHEGKKYKVTKINDRAFCHGAAKVVILPPTIETIGKEAFAGCSKLKKIFLPNSITKIGENAFSGTGLEEIVLPTGLKEIAPWTFLQCYRLETVVFPDSLVRIGKGAFMDSNIKLGNSLPNSLKYIDDQAFKGAAVYETIIPASVEKIGNEAFSQTHIIPKFMNPSELKEIGEKAFERSRGIIMWLILPESVKTIGSRAFAQCEYLHYVVLPDVQHFGEEIFYEDKIDEVYYITDTPRTADWKMFKRYDGTLFVLKSMKKEMESIVPWRAFKIKEKERNKMLKFGALSVSGGWYKEVNDKFNKLMKQEDKSQDLRKEVEDSINSTYDNIEELMKIIYYD